MTKNEIRLEIGNQLILLIVLYSLIKD